MLKGNTFEQNLLLIIVFTFWISFDIHYGIRLVDIFVLIFVFVNLLNYKNLYKSLYSNNLQLIYLYFLITWTINIFLAYNVTTTGISLLSYLLLYILFFYYLSRSILPIIDDLIKGLIIAIIVISLWIIFYATTYYIFFTGHHSRPSYPFSFDNIHSDAHVLGSYISITIIFLIGTKKYLKLNNFLYAFLLILLFLSIYLTSSRTGFYSLILIFFVMLFKKINASRVYSLCLSIIFFGLILYLVNEINFFSGFKLLFTNESESSRLTGLDNSLNNSFRDYFFISGKSLLFANQLYFDGTLTFLLYNFGIFSLILYLYLLYFLLHEYLSGKNFSYLFLFAILLNLLTTEFFLISRWLIPVILYYYIILNLKNYNNN